MKVLKYGSYYGLTFLYSVVIGFIGWTFLYVVNTVTHFLWLGHEGSGGFMYEHPILIFPFIFFSSLGLAYIYSNYEVIPRPGIAYAKEFKEHKKVEYQDFFKVYILAMLPLFLGSSVGPEAALVGLFFMLASYSGDATDRIEEKLGVVIIENRQEGFFNNIKANKFYTLKILVMYVTVSYTLLKLLDFDKYPSFNVMLEPITITNKLELLAIIPLVLVGYLLARFYKVTEHPIEHFMNSFNNQYKKMAITAICLAFAAYVFPILIMSGEATLHILVDRPWVASSVLLLILSILKILLTHICISGDLRGGHIFPIIYSAFLMGAGISFIFDIDSTLAIACVTSAMTLSIFSSYIAVFLLLALFFPFKILVLIFLVLLLIGEGRAAILGKEEI